MVVKRLIGVALLAQLFLMSTFACTGGAPPERFKQKLVILGFDGMDPRLAEQWIAAGKLPNLAKLAAQGGLHRLETSHSPESPTAWASFATGANAGKHNIYDFLVRDTKTYLPDLAMVKREPAQFLFNYIPISRPKITSTRGGTSFWVTAGAAGVRSSILTVPVTFPPEEVKNGELLSGLPLPDIRGTMGTFYYFASDLSRYEEGNTEFGGILKRLVFEKNVAPAQIIGPRNPTNREQELSVPLSITWNHEARSANIAIAGEQIHLTEKQWSKWIPIDFSINTLLTVHGMTQFYLIDAGQDLKLYVAPVNWHPSRPPTPMSYPPGLSADLYERLGPYRTLGWPEATWPLNEERIDEQTFMDDLDRAFNDRAATILNRIDSRRWDLLVGVIETTDRVQHMMWRYTDPEHPLYNAAEALKWGSSIEKIYQKADEFVGQVMERLAPGTALMVVSDHGFHSFRYGVNLNTWLVSKGYMTLKGQRPGEKKLDDLFSGGGTFWENVDWSNTRAYSMGLGQVYVNLKGREGQGIVSTGADYEALLNSLVKDLKEFRDTRTGRTIVRNVYKRSDTYSGPFFNEAADLQVGFEDGYRTSWQTALGGTPPQIIEPNMKKWSGDHGSFDYQITPGILISSTKPTSTDTRIIDIAPTVLKYFGLTIPKDIDGKPIF